MANQTKNIYLGIFVVIAAFLLIWGFLFLQPISGDGKQIIHVRFNNIDKINVGTRVTLAGKPIGEIISISEVFNARESSENTYDEVFFYNLTLSIDSSAVIYTNDIFTIHTSGLLGEKTITIIPQPIRNNNEKKEITEETIVHAQVGNSMEKSFEQMGVLITKANRTIDILLTLVLDNKKELNETVTYLNNSLKNIATTTETVNSTQLVEQTNLAIIQLNAGLDKLNRSFNTLENENFWNTLSETSYNLKEITTTLNQPELISKTLYNVNNFSGQLALLTKKANDSWESFTDTFENLSQASAHFNRLAGKSDSIISAISEGKGSVGKLVMEDTLYLRSMSVMSRIETLMNDINHYGLLFQNNKSWQRQRIKRVNQLHKLADPLAFKDFFHEEVAQISSSLGRVSLLLDKVDSVGEKENTMFNDSPQFIKAFNELLRQVKGIEDNLTLFNEELMENNQP
jgi:phospholipid/cholesterol/gamma-HCH transport system substrate-binding protein